ncbi:MAG: hypothetical protein J6B71_02300, partial [Clostridia bacterium]|nr:hypothetical protein [Clostridia bacterium]
MSVSTMKKLTVLTYTKDADAVVRRLMNLKCVQIKSSSSQNGLMPIGTLEIDQQKSTAERRLADIRAALPTLARYTTRKGGLGRTVHRVDRAAFCKEGRDARAWQAVCDTLDTVARLEALTAEQTRNAALMSSVEPWLGYDLALDVDGSQKTEILRGSCPADTDVLALREELEARGVCFEEISQDENRVYLALTLLRSDADAVERSLLEKGFLKSEFAGITTTARGAFEACEVR